MTQNPWIGSPWLTQMPPSTGVVGEQLHERPLHARGEVGDATRRCGAAPGQIMWMSQSGRRQGTCFGGMPWRYRPNFVSMRSSVYVIGTESRYEAMISAVWRARSSGLE